MRLSKTDATKIRTSKTIAEALLADCAKLLHVVEGLGFRGLGFRVYGPV